MSKKKRIATMILGPAGPQAGAKIEQGSLHALMRKPVFLLNTKSDHNRILAVLYAMGGQQSSKDVCRLFNQKYHATKSATAISARLSELFTLSLVNRVRMHGHKGKLLYWLPIEIDITSPECMYKQALERQKLMQDLVNGKAKLCALPNSPASIIFEV